MDYNALVRLVYDARRIATDKGLRADVSVKGEADFVTAVDTGISAFINQRGDIVEQTSWWERGYLTGTLNLNEEKTIFTRYGDIIGRISRFLAFLFLLMGVARKIAKKHIGIK